MLRIALDEGLEALLRAGVVAILQVLEGVVILRLALGPPPPPAGGALAARFPPPAGGVGLDDGAAGRGPPLPPFSSASRRYS